MVNKNAFSFCIFVPLDRACHRRVKASSVISIACSVSDTRKRQKRKIAAASSL